MGLGLSVCSAVVKAHGGRLTAHNHPDGAEFIFCLPMPPPIPLFPLIYPRRKPYEHP